MKRIGLVLGASLLCGAFAVSGCKKDEKKEDAKGTAADPAAAGAKTDDKGVAGTTTPPTGADAVNTAGAPPAGGGEAAATASTPSADEQVLAEKAAQLMDDMAKIAEASKDNCDKAATDMKALFEKAKPILEAGKKFKDDPGKQKWFEEKYGTRMIGAMSKLMPLMEKCQNHEGLKAVFESMD